MPQLERELPTLERTPTGTPRQAGPCVMVIFGATGDLTARKLFPALYNLAKSNLLSREFAIVGIGRNDYTVDQFRQVMGGKAAKLRHQQRGQRSQGMAAAQVVLRRGRFRGSKLIHPAWTDSGAGGPEPQHPRKLLLLSGDQPNILWSDCRTSWSIRSDL